MKKLLFIFFLIQLNTVFCVEILPFNYTIIPGYNLFDNDNPVYIGTGLFSSTLTRVQALQISPIYNETVNGFTGIQNTLGFNISKSYSKGIQISGLVNISDSITGLQIANISNITQSLKGIQIGLINRAEESVGVQLGIVNISDDLRGNTVGLGLINIYKFGILDFTAIYDTNKNIIYYYESGSSRFFSQFYLELNNEIGEDIDYKGVVWGTGLGFKILPTLDLVAGAKRSFKYLFTKPTIQISKGFNYKRFSLVIGARGDLKIKGYNDDFFTNSKMKFGTDYIALYYSFFTGIRIHIDNSYINR